MANEFIIKNGFYSQGNSAVTGSLIISASSDTNDLQVGTDKLFVSASGDIGIGTITPRSKMDISGSIYIASNMTSYSTRPTVGTASLQYGGIHSYSPSEGAKSDAGFLRISAGGEITASNKTFIDLSGYSNVSDMNQNIVFGTRDQERMRIDQDGDVGIGISTPTARLHITHTDAYDAFRVEDETNPDVSPFIINNLGNVGIGTDSPNYKLDVAGEVSIRGGSDADDARMYFQAADNSNRFTIETDFDPLIETDKLGFRSILSDNILVLQGDGNVGIGTTSQFTKLTVDGTISLLSTLNSTSGSIYIDHPGVTVWNMGITSTNTSTFHIGNGAGFANKIMNITNAGNVGIGTTTPNAKLDVNGNTIITGSLTVTDGITASLQGTSSYSTLSLDTVNKATYTVGIMSGSENWSTSNNGTITLPTVDVLLYDNANFSGSAKLYTVLGGTTGTGGIPALTDHDTNYITIEYNGGSPIYNVSTADTSNDSNINLVYITYRLGNFVHILDFGNQGAGLANKINRRIEKTNRFGRESGLNLNLSGSTGIAIIASGVAWNGSNRQTLAEVNSNDDIFFKNYRASSTWSYTTAQNYINNTYYDNGTDLVPITSGSYVVNWYYRGQELNDHIYEVVSQDEYANVAEARLATAPTLPELIESHAFLAGRIIIQSGSYDGIVESAYTSVFQATTVTSHNDLVGLQGGSGNQYYHLNSNEYTNIVLKNVNNHFTAGQTISGSLNISGSLQVGGIILGDGGIQLSGSSNINGDTAITGSLTVTGNLGSSDSSIDMNAMIQASLLYLSNNF